MFAITVTVTVHVAVSHVAVFPCGRFPKWPFSYVTYLKCRISRVVRLFLLKHPDGSQTGSVGAGQNAVDGPISGQQPRTQIISIVQTD
jgi:hypothetical protein